MIKSINVWLAAAAIWVLQSCSVNTETTYYNDAATSMESNILMDQSMLMMLNASGNTSPIKNSKEFSKLSTEWKSLYDIQKDQKVTLNQDSVKVLKKLFLKLNKEKGELYGLSLKYDKLLPSEVASLLSQSKQLKSLPLQNFAVWNGKVLTIDAGKFNSSEILSQIKADKTLSTPPKSKSDSIQAYGKQMAQGVVGMMKMFNMNFTNTLKFQKPIKSITGKHDFVKQIDNRTIQINVRSNDLLDEGKTLTNKDKTITITTE